jgi:hypothetical protein
MIRISILIIFLLASRSIFAQNIGIYFSKNYLGNNLKIGYSMAKKPNVWTEIGLKYHFNRRNYFDPRAFAYYKTGFAENVENHLGLFVNRSATFYQNNYGLKLYGLVGLDYLHLASKVEIQSYTGVVDSMGLPTYRIYEIVSPKYHSLELNLGIGAKVKIADKMNLILETGVSGVFLYYPEKILGNNNGYIQISNGTKEIDFIGWMAKLGIIYLVN